MRAYHNSREKTYRAPYGACPVGSTVTLTLDVWDVSWAKVTCRIWIDGQGETLHPMKQAQQGANHRFTCEIPLTAPNLVWYHFIIEHDGNWAHYGARAGCVGGEGALHYGEPPSFQITVYQQREAPSWYRNGLVYQIFPDRFFRGADYEVRVRKALEAPRKGPERRFVADWGKPPVYEKDEQGRVTAWDFYGGTLRGIAEKLPYLQSLGVTALYLNPIFEAASNHRYDTADYERLDPMLGDDGDFECFAAEAARYGISLILDGVFNHTGCDSIYFNKYGNYPSPGAYESEDSPYRPWFNFRQDGTYSSWWGVDDLPDVNENDESYREFITRGERSVLRRWLKAGAKGWRLDVADELPDDFIAEMKCAVLETLGSEGLLIGEVWEDASNKQSYGALRRYLLGDELDGAMNYPFRDILTAFLLGNCSASDAKEGFAALHENYPPEAFYAALNLMGSHDRPRILTVLGEAPDGGGMSPEEAACYRLPEEKRELAKTRLWLMTLLQMTFPGVPCIYYGDEAGMEGLSDPYNRACYPWGAEDADAAAIFRNAASLRRALPLFVSGSFEPLAYGEDVFGFIRALDGEAAVVLVNRSTTESHTVEVPALSEDVTELVGGRSITLENGTARLVLYPLGSAVIYFKKSASMAKKLPRGAGVLCHITSLPNEKNAGTLGKPAMDFIDFLADAGQKYWQILPLNPTDEYGSPYAGVSAFAGNSLLLDTAEETLRARFASFEPTAEYQDFCAEQAHWLYPYAAFMAIRARYPGKVWQDWPKQYKKYSKSLLEDEKLRESVGFYLYQQYEFSVQWDAVRRYANEKGIHIIGDMPIYVSEDSADVWAHPEIFTLGADGRKNRSAGVPPDYFAKDGQNWGNPLYDWSACEKEGYAWWMNRLARAFSMFDYVRLDHFCGFAACWSIPLGKTAAAGTWQRGPGRKFFETAYARFGTLKIIAEDLGQITPGVRSLLAGCGFSGMDVVQFYDGDVRQEYQPPRGKIAYTGTHDNATLRGWCADRFPEQDAEILSQEIIERTLQCGAEVVIMPLQDVLGLSDEARMNTPGVAEGNWRWQAQKEGLADAAKKLREQTESVNR